jgi:thioredoxin-like negative regulator of GroEL
MGRYSSQPEEHVHGPDCNHETQLNKEEIFEIPQEGKVLLKFESNDCPHCKTMDDIINASKDPGVPIMRVNVQKHPMNAQLANDVNVQALPTLILVENGEEKSRHTGTLSADQFYLFAQQ